MEDKIIAAILTAGAVIGKGMAPSAILETYDLMIAALDAQRTSSEPGGGKQPLNIAPELLEALQRRG